MLRHTRSVATLAIVTLVAVATLLLGILGIINHISESRKQRAELEAEATTMAKQMSAGLALPLWNFDRPQIEKIIESAMEAPEVYAVVVRQPDVSAPGGMAMYSKSRDSGSPLDGADEAAAPFGLLAKAEPVMASGERVGKVKVFLTTALVEQQLRKSLIYLAMRIIGLDLLLILSLYILLRRTVLLPLQAVEKYASDVAAGGTRDKPPVGAGRFSGEIESLRTSIEKMIGLLDDRYVALKKSEGMMSCILNTVPLFIFWKDREGRYLGCNKVFARDAAGVAKPEDVIGKTDFDFPWSQDGAAEFRAQDREVIETGQPKRHMIQPRRPADGVERWMDTTKVPLVDSEGNVFGVLGVFDDVTEQKKSQALLLESEKMRTVAGLAAGMAHEINNPLAAMSQASEVICNRISPDAPVNRAAAEECGTTVEAVNQYMQKRGITQMLDTICTSGERAARIVANMLSFSRENAAEMRPQNLAALLDRTLELANNDYDVKRNRDFRRITVKRDFADAVPDVECQEGEIQQVVLNLFKNSVQAMAEGNGYNGDPRIVVRTRRDGPMVRIEIEDNGPGMTEDVRRRVFEPFYTTKNSADGTGLGLSVSYFIVVEKHHGEMEVESSPGRGAKFVIKLPLHQPAS